MNRQLEIPRLKSVGCIERQNEFFEEFKCELGIDGAWVPFRLHDTVLHKPVPVSAFRA